MVNACVVLTVGEEGEDKSLVAYIVPESNGQETPVTKKDVRAALKKLLPFYMVPSYFIFMNRSCSSLELCYSHLLLCMALHTFLL